MNNKILIAGGAIVVLVAVWYMTTSAPKAEAPTVAEETTQSEQGESTSSTTPAVDATTTPAAVPVPPPATQKQVTAPVKTAAPVAKKPAFMTVTYSGNDFLPRVATITLGGTVRFYNNSEYDMWVASDLHPLHSAYPEKSKKDCAGSTFDMCRTISKGQYWDFTFNKAGTWRYHNEERPVDGGTIEVIDPEEKPSSIPGY